MPPRYHIITMVSIGSIATLIGLISFITHEPGGYNAPTPPIGTVGLTVGLSLLLLAWALQIITEAIAAHAELTTKDK